MNFQIASIKAMSGVAKESKRPYSMLIVAGMLTADDGEVSVGEIIFMERAGHPLPLHLRAGGKYTPVIGASARNGRLQFEIVELQPVVAAASKVPAAVAG